MALRVMVVVVVNLGMMNPGVVRVRVRLRLLLLLPGRLSVCSMRKTSAASNPTSNPCVLLMVMVVQAMVVLRTCCGWRCRSVRCSSGRREHTSVAPCAHRTTTTTTAATALPCVAAAHAAIA
jgi:hypothetical protein